MRKSLMMLLRQSIVGLGFLLYSLSLFALTSANECQSLACVRENIDELDTAIVALIGQRMSYVLRASDLKNDCQAIYDAKREQMIFQKVSKEAKSLGYPPSVAIEIYKAILTQAKLLENKKLCK